jgi:hypothetical protein
VREGGGAGRAYARDLGGDRAGGKARRTRAEGRGAEGGHAVGPGAEAERRRAGVKVRVRAEGGRTGGRVVSRGKKTYHL